MKYLTVIRHAKSSWSHPTLSDHDRPLNKRGKKSAPMMGKRLASNLIQFDAIFTSSARRACDTIHLIANEIGFSDQKITATDELYHFGYQQIIKFIQTIDDYLTDVAITGHNPAFHDLSAVLTHTDILYFPTCSIARIKLKIDRWSQLSAGCGKLVFLDYPKKDKI